MQNLLRSDFYKLKRAKPFWVCVILCVSIALITIVANKAALELIRNMPEAIGQDIQSNIENAQNETVFGITSSQTGISDIENASGYAYIAEAFGSGEIFPILLCIFCCLFITREFSQRTIQNSIAVGKSRYHAYISKLITLFVGTLILQCVYWISHVVLASLFFGFGTVLDVEKVLAILRMICLQSLLNAGAASLFIMLAFVMRGTGVTLSVGITGFMFVRVLLQVGGFLLGKALNMNVNLDAAWLTSNMTLAGSFDLSTSETLRIALVGIAYIVLPACVGARVFAMRDL